tara:strand:+ start:826 stop:3423 length:2598 start_codon:yes stop_codon:yes gene_type:complete
MNKLFNILLIIVAFTTDSIADNKVKITNDDLQQKSLYDFAQSEIENYLSIDHGAGTQNWGITQDHNGILYFANNHGVLVFNGESWKTIRLPNMSANRSIVSDDKGNIIWGGRGDFGYLSNSNGSITAISLKEKLDINYKSNSIVYDSIQNSEGLVFRTKEKIFYIKQNNVQQINAPKGKKLGVAKLINNKVYVNVEGVGLHMIVNGDIKPVPYASGFNTKEKNINGFHKKDDEFIIFTRRDGIFKISNKMASPIIINHKVLKSTTIYRTYQLKDKKIALATYDGVFILNNDYQVIEHYNESNGLNADNVRSLYEDREGNLWVGLNNGIAKIKRNINLKFFDRKFANIDFKILSHKIIGNDILLATSTGLKISRTDENKISKVFIDKNKKDLKSQVFSLLKDDENIFIGSLKGLGIINSSGDYSSLISSNITGSVFSIKQSRINKNYILIGAKKGFFIIDKGNPKDILKINEIKSKVSNFVESDELKTIFIREQNIGIHVLKIDNFKDNNYKINLFNKNVGFPDLTYIKPHRINNKIIISTFDGIFEYKPLSSSFVRNDKFINIPLISKKLISKVAKISDDQYFLNVISYENQQRKQQFYIVNGNENKEIYLNEIRHHNFANISSWKGMIILSGNEGVVFFDLDKLNSESKSKIILSKIKNNNKLIYNLGTLEDYSNKTFIIKDLYDYEHNTIQFNISVTNYRDEETNMYRYKLDGLEDRFSDYDKHGIIKYIGLPSGTYNLLVETKTSDGSIIKGNIFEFTIEKPWWESIYFYLAQIIIFSILLFTIVFSKENSAFSKYTTSIIFVIIIIMIEFLTLKVEPFVNMLSDGVPVFKLIANILVAIILEPINNFVNGVIQKTRNKINV